MFNRFIKLIEKFERLYSLKLTKKNVLKFKKNVTKLNIKIFVVNKNASFKKKREQFFKIFKQLIFFVLI